VQSKFFQSDDEEGTLFARAIAPQIIERHLTDGEVIHAVDSLPANYRAVVLLADVEEFDYKEIARILNVPIGTVMSRLSRARQQLRKSLTGAAREFGIKNLGAIVQRQTAACAA
jgi:RNA polymerase sigma-70 factor (ECF subfamily)